MFNSNWEAGRGGMAFIAEVNLIIAALKHRGVWGKLNHKRMRRKEDKKGKHFS